MQQAEIIELFSPLLRQSAQRRRVTDYVAMLLLLGVIAWIANSVWRNNQIPKIESLTLVPNSVTVIGPAPDAVTGGVTAFCPGDLFTIRYQIAIGGEGVIYADDAAHRQQQTVKFSTLWRDIVTPSVRTYENPWVIPSRPDMPIDGQRRWVPGRYTRVISVAASNIYISRYVAPATFEVPFEIRDDCP